MAVQTKISWEEFQQAGEEWRRWECVDGEIEFMSVNMSHETFIIWLVLQLAQFCASHPEWVAFGSNAVFTMASGNWRMPDVSLVRRQRFRGGALPDKADFGPDVAFEIISPSDSPSRIQSRRKDYKETRIVQLWFDLEEQTAEVIYPDRPVQYFDSSQILHIDCVPGLAIDLARLFAGLPGRK